VLCATAKEAAEELTKAAQAAAADAPSPAQPASEEVDDGAAFDSASPEAIDPAAVAKKQLDDILTAGLRLIYALNRVLAPHGHQMISEASVRKPQCQSLCTLRQLVKFCQVI